MSGPIVRSGPSPEYSKNWSNAFGQKDDSKKEKQVAEKTKKTKKSKGKKKKR